VVVVTIRPGKFRHVDRDHGAYLSGGRRGKSPAGRPGHRAARREAGRPAVGMRRVMTGRDGI
jgi:hypothetical protein